MHAYFGMKMFVYFNKLKWRNTRMLGQKHDETKGFKRKGVNNDNLISKH